MNIQEIMQLIDKVSNSKLNEFVLEEGNTKLTLKSNRGIVTKEEQDSNTIEKVETLEIEKQEGAKSETVVTEIPPAILKEEVSAKKPVTGNIVTSPLVGTFYAAPGEDKPPFVSIGDKVKKGQVIGIVEAMKLMNEVESEFDGTVVDILVENEDIVEFGQPLVVIE